MDEVENSQSTTQALGDVDQAPDGAHVDNPPDGAFSTPSPYPLTFESAGSRAQECRRRDPDKTRRPLRQLTGWRCLMTKHGLLGSTQTERQEWCGL